MITVTDNRIKRKHIQLRSNTIVDLIILMIHKSRKPIVTLISVNKSSSMYHHFVGFIVMNITVVHGIPYAFSYVSI